MAQRLGTSRLALSFAPGITSFLNINKSGKKNYLLYFLVTFIWILLLGTSGVVNIISFPGVLRALDPSRAILREILLPLPFTHLHHHHQFRAPSFYPVPIRRE